jgi:phosphoribosylglycinamide formyltransferase-1
LVLTDRLCVANDFSNEAKIENRIIDFEVNGQSILLSELNKIEPDIIITTVHKILCKKIVDEFKGRIINLHYSLLPAFGGLIGSDSVDAAVNYGASFTGVTVHFVNENIDSGKPITQVAIPLRSREKDFYSLMNIVFRSGCIALMTSINTWGEEEGSLDGVTHEILGRNCFFSRNFNSPKLLSAPEFWEGISNSLS